jgi:hypothetical protein
MVEPVPFVIVTLSRAPTVLMYNVVAVPVSFPLTLMLQPSILLSYSPCLIPGNSTVIVAGIAIDIVGNKEAAIITIRKTDKSLFLIFIIQRSRPEIEFRAAPSPSSI